MKKKDSGKEKEDALRAAVRSITAASAVRDVAQHREVLRASRVHLTR